MNSCIKIGLVVSNYNPNSTVIATFANVSHTGSAPVQSSQLLGNTYTVASEQYQPDFTVYPNPTYGELNINLREYSDRNAQLEIYSLEGKMPKIIRIEEAQATTETVLLNEYPSGMYFVKLKPEGLPDVTKRIVVNK